MVDERPQLKSRHKDGLALIKPQRFFLNKKPLADSPETPAAARTIEFDRDVGFMLADASLKSFVWDWIWACTSKPTTICQRPPRGLATRRDSG